MNGQNLLIGLSHIDRKFIEESENDTVSAMKGTYENSVQGRKVFRKPLLVAAIVALMLFLMGCAAVVLFHLNDLKIGEQTYIQHPLYLEDGTKTPATEKVKEIISVQGVAESPNQQGLAKHLSSLPRFFISTLHTGNGIILRFFNELSINMTQANQKILSIHT